MTYQLVYCQREVLSEIVSVRKNETLWSAYRQQIGRIVGFDEYDTPEKLPFEGFRKKVEKRIFQQNIQRPVTQYFITVYLHLTTINGAVRTHKRSRFSIQEIEYIIGLLRQKKGDFYTSDEVWQSICRVERARVSNKMRFAVYQRDNNRCRKCGSRYNLEVDHIYPIAKGGKSIFDNMQTLCHNCNVEKGSKVEEGAIPPRRRDHHTLTCHQCQARLIVKMENMASIMRVHAFQIVNTQKT